MKGFWAELNWKYIVFGAVVLVGSVVVLIFGH